MTILVVDDNQVLRRAVERSLTRSGAAVRGAATLADARASVAQCRPAVLCLDLHLPDGCGLELVGELRAAHDPMPVVVMSGSEDDRQRVRARALGVAAFVTKPFSLGNLSEVLEHACNGQLPLPSGAYGGLDGNAARIATPVVASTWLGRLRDRFLLSHHTTRTRDA